MELDPNAVQHEAQFWKGFVKSERFLGWIDKSRKTPELNETAAAILRVAARRRMPCPILDVGSGPVSILTGLLKAEEAVITAADPLAEEYAEMVDYAGHLLSPPCPVAAEDLLEYFGPNAFSIVHCSNALDHVANVETALRAMCHVAQSMVMVQGFVDEADHERFQGFHQHNLSLDGDSLVWRGVKHKTLLRPLDFSMTCTYSSQHKTALGRDWFMWVLEK